MNIQQIRQDHTILGVFDIRHDRESNKAYIDLNDDRDLDYRYSDSVQRHVNHEPAFNMGAEQMHSFIHLNQRGVSDQVEGENPIPVRVVTGEDVPEFGTLELRKERHNSDYPAAGEVGTMDGAAARAAEENGFDAEGVEWAILSAGSSHESRFIIFRAK